MPSPFLGPKSIESVGVAEWPGEGVTVTGIADTTFSFRIRHSRWSELTGTKRRGGHEKNECYQRGGLYADPKDPLRSA